MRPRSHEHPSLQGLGWLRASVLGANDGIVSTASLILGVAAAHAAHADILLSAIAALRDWHASNGRSELPRPVSVLLVSDEEVGSDSSRGVERSGP